MPAGLKGGFATVEAAATVKNLGETLLRVSNVDIRLQSADLDDQQANILATMPPEAWPTDRSKFPFFNEAELQWPVLRWFRSDIEHEIERGETDTITATFVVPCSIHTVRVTVGILKKESHLLFSSTNPLDWKARALTSTESACSAKIGGS